MEPVWEKKMALGTWQKQGNGVKSEGKPIMLLHIY